MESGDTGTDGTDGPIALTGPSAPSATRWVVFSAMCVVYLTFGIVVLAIPPMMSDVRADLGLSRGAIGFALGAWALLYIVTAPPAGRVIDRVGLHRSLAAGAFLVALSAAAQALAQNLAMLWLAIAIVGVGGPLISLSAPKLVAVWFTDPRERALAIGFYTSAPAIGGAIALAATNSVLLPLLGHWRVVLLAEAAACVLAGLLWTVVSRRSPSLPVAATAGGVDAARSLLRSPGVRLAVVLGIGSFFMTQGLSAWLPDILVELRGFETATAANWAAVSLTIGIVARLAIPGLARPERRSLVVHTVLAAMLVALTVLAVGPAGWAVAAVIVLGLRSVLNSLVSVILMEADQVTAANAGLAYGLWFAAVEVGGAAGPLAVGALGDSSAGFAGALLAMAGVTALMMMALFVFDVRARQPGRRPSRR